MKKVVIVGASRTPMGGFHGEMSQATAPELGGAATVSYTHLTLPTTGAV